MNASVAGFHLNELNIATRKAAYKALIESCRAACKAEFPAGYVDKVYPYPLFTVDAEKGEIVLGNAYILKVDSNGKISGDINVNEVRESATPTTLIKKFFRDRQRIICTRFMTKLDEVIAAGNTNNLEDYWTPVRENWLAFAASMDPLEISNHKEGIKLALNLEKPERWSGIVAANAERAFVAAVKQLLDRNSDIAWLRRRLFWVRQVKTLNFKHWNMIAATAKVIRQIQSDSPRMVALFVIAVLLPATQKKQKPKISLKDPKNAISALRAYLITQGLTPTAWRWISHLPCPTAAKVVAGVFNPRLCAPGVGARVANICAERQMRPRPSIYQAALGFMSRIHDHAHADDFVVVLLALGSNGIDSIDIDFSISLVADWLMPKAKEHAPSMATQIAVGRAWPDSPVLNEGAYFKPPRGIGWKRLLELQRDWHDKAQMTWDAQADYHDDIERLLGKSQSKPDKSWDSLISTSNNGFFAAAALTSETELRIEGRRMHHCVGSYAAECRKGQSRIFSITDNEGKRVATLELVCRSRRWSIRQCFGYCNQEVSDEVYLFAEKLCADYQLAYLKAHTGNDDDSLKGLAE